MKKGKAKRYTALQGGEGGSKFCQKVSYVMVERSLTALELCQRLNNTN